MLFRPTVFGILVARNRTIGRAIGVTYLSNAHVFCVVATISNSCHPMPPNNNFTGLRLPMTRKSDGSNTIRERKQICRQHYRSWYKSRRLADLFSCFLWAVFLSFTIIFTFEKRKKSEIPTGGLARVRGGPAWQQCHSESHFTTITTALGNGIRTSPSSSSSNIYTNWSRPYVCITFNDWRSSFAYAKPHYNEKGWITKMHKEDWYDLERGGDTKRRYSFSWKFILFVSTTQQPDPNELDKLFLIRFPD